MIDALRQGSEALEQERKDGKMRLVLRSLRNAALLLPVLTLALAFVSASPTSAQQGPVEATGMLGGPYTRAPNPEPLYALTDEETGTPYEITSNSVDLEPYVGQNVTIRGGPLSDVGPPSAPDLINVTQVESAQNVNETVAVGFELAVEGEPPSETTFFGVVGVPGFGAGSESVRLTDPDGDGVYSGSVEVPRGTRRGVLIERGMGVKENPLGFDYPGEPRSVVEDFGLVKLDEDEVFLASAYFGNGSSGSGGQA